MKCTHYSRYGVGYQSRILLSQPFDSILYVAVSQCDTQTLMQYLNIGKQCACTRRLLARHPSVYVFLVRIVQFMHSNAPQQTLGITEMQMQVVKRSKPN